jgi:rhamnosyltransferase
MNGARGVLGVVVTYNPGPDLRQNLAALRSQVDDLLVVDNGSSDQAAVHRTVAETGGRLVANERNLGIAAALNQALDVAVQEGFDWIATFDQDSLCEPGAVPRLLALEQRHPHRERIGVLAMAHRDRALQRDYHHRVDILQEDQHWRTLRTAITAGSLARVRVLESAGGFDGPLFIDSVDQELCLRLRRRGWLIVEARQVVLVHSIGAAAVHRFLGVPVVCTHHSPVRRYYQVRNMLELARRFAFFDPAWTFKSLFQLAQSAVAVALFEEQRGAKLQAMARGVIDFLRRRFGPVK